MTANVEALVASYCAESGIDRLTFNAFLTVAVDDDSQIATILPRMSREIEMTDQDVNGCFALAGRLNEEFSVFSEMLRKASQEHSEPIELSVQFFVCTAIAAAALEHAAAVVRRRLKEPLIKDRIPGFEKLGDWTDAAKAEALIKGNFPGLAEEYPQTFEAVKELYSSPAHQDLRFLRALANIGKHRRLVRVYCNYEVIGAHDGRLVSDLRTTDFEAFKKRTAFVDWYTEEPERLLVSDLVLAGNVGSMIVRIIATLDE